MKRPSVIIPTWFVDHIELSTLKSRTEPKVNEPWFKALKEDIEANGLMSPIMVSNCYNRGDNHKMAVTCGTNRMAALLALGWTHAPAILYGTLPVRVKGVRLKQLKDIQPYLGDGVIEQNNDGSLRIGKATTPESMKYPRNTRPYFSGDRTPWIDTPVNIPTWFVKSMPVDILNLWAPSNEDEGWYSSLRQNISANGLMSPLVIANVAEKDLHMSIRTGQNRYRCICDLGWTHIPCLIYGTLPEGIEGIPVPTIEDAQTYIADGDVTLIDDGGFGVYATQKPEEERYPKHDKPYRKEDVCPQS